jgi:hypothetical protein
MIREAARTLSHSNGQEVVYWLQGGGWVERRVVVKLHSPRPKSLPIPEDDDKSRTPQISLAKTRSELAGMTTEAECANSCQGGPSAVTDPPFPRHCGLTQKS